LQISNRTKRREAVGQETSEAAGVLSYGARRLQPSVCGSRRIASIAGRPWARRRGAVQVVGRSEASQFERSRLPGASENGDQRAARSAGGRADARL